MDWRSVLLLAGVLACGGRSSLDSSGEGAVEAPDSAVRDAATVAEAGAITCAALSDAALWSNPPNNPDECDFGLTETCSDGNNYFFGCNCFGVGGSCSCGHGPASQTSGEGTFFNGASQCTSAFDNQCPMPSSALYATMCGFPLPQ
jgi:hypothetical protein